MKYPHNLIIIPLFIGVILMTFNQRIGWWDESGLRMFSIVFRSEFWFILSFFAAIFNIKVLLQRTFSRLGLELIIVAPMTFLTLALSTSFFNLFSNNYFYDYFGIIEFIKILICIYIGCIVYFYASRSIIFENYMVSIFLLVPLINIFAGSIYLIFGINNIPGYNDINGFETLGSGIVGFGGRFQGVGSNANLAMTQTYLGLAVLIPRFSYACSKANFFKRAMEVSYAIGLCLILIWTGVRTALIITPLILIIYYYINARNNVYRPKISLVSLLRFFLFIIILIVVCYWLDFFNMYLGRFKWGDGRLFLWEHYTKLLIYHPQGFGLGFESIVDVNSLIYGQRLPPHNAILQAGMYAGIGGVILTLYYIYKLSIINIYYLKKFSNSILDKNSVGIILAWFVVLIANMFSGLLQSDFNLSILTALILGSISRMACADLKRF